MLVSIPARRHRRRMVRTPGSVRSGLVGTVPCPPSDDTGHRWAASCGGTEAERFRRAEGEVGDNGDRVGRDWWWNEVPGDDSDGDDNLSVGEKGLY